MCAQTAIDTSGLGAWAGLPFFQTRFPCIEQALRAESRDVLPPASDIFSALRLTSPDQTRVVILGQDPYPTPGHAHGLAFSVAPDVTPLPRSLSNIYKEMVSDIGQAPMTGDLRFWAKQGVLLLNTVLTVPAGVANGHKDLGWQTLTHQILAHVSTRPTAFVLWGKQAQALAPHITSPTLGANSGCEHLVIQTAHPSPLSARRGFFGSHPFSRINSWLSECGKPQINWTTG